jgi:thioredoxin reductase (NADPH)
VEADPKITIEYDTEVTELHGADSLEAVTVRELKTGETRLLHIPALFIMVGAAPNTEWLSGLVELDDKGFVITGRGTGERSKPWEIDFGGHVL